VSKVSAFARYTVPVAIICVLTGGIAGANAAIVASGPAPSKEPVNTPLPQTGFFDMVVDGVHQHEFVTGDPADHDPLVVLDQDGHIVKILDDLDGAAGLALDPTGSLLYVTIRTKNTVDVVDTSTLEEVDTYSVGGRAGCPGFATFVAGRLWFGVTCATHDRVVGIASLDPSTGAVRTFLGRNTPVAEPLVRSTPALPDDLFAAEQTRTGEATVRRYRIRADGSLRLAATLPTGRPLLDFRPTPDGRDVLVGSCPIATYDVRRLKQDQTYDGVCGYSPFVQDAVATTWNGGYVMTAAFECGTDDLFLHYRHDTNQAKAFKIIGGTFIEEFLEPTAMAFDESGDRLFLVTSTDFDSRRPQFMVLYDPLKHDPLTGAWARDEAKLMAAQARSEPPGGDADDMTPATEP
jgi:hypothetical protein